jgi:hypothetical protein
MIGAGTQPIALNQCSNALFTLFHRNTRQHHWQFDILRRSEARHEMERLENESDFFATHMSLLFIT